MFKSRIVTPVTVIGTISATSAALALMDLSQITNLLGFFSYVITSGILTYSILTKKLNFELNTLAYSFGIGIAQLMLVGLIINSIGLLFSLQVFASNGPLPITLALLPIIEAAILLLHRKPSIHIPHTPRLIALSRVDMSLLLISIATVISAILSVLSLNNNTETLLPLVTAALFLASVLIGVYKKNKINTITYILSIFVMTTALLLQISLKGDGLFGSDIQEEYALYRVVIESGNWIPTSTNAAYNACLSITVLPAIMSSVFQLNDYIIFKLILPLFAAFAAINVFLIGRIFLQKRLAYFAAIVFISYQSYWLIMPMHLRTAVAFFILSLFFLTFFDRTLGRYTKIIFQGIFLVALVLAHYSTAWLLLALLIISKVIELIMQKSFGTKQIISWSVIVIALLSSYIWLGQITKAADNLNSTIETSVSKFTKIFSQEESSSQASLKNQFTLQRSNNSHKLLEGYKQQNNVSTLAQDIRVVPLEQHAYVAPQWISDSLYNILSIASMIMKLMIILSPVAVCFFILQSIRRNKKASNRRDALHTLLPPSLASLLLLGAVVVIPFLSIIYSLDRTYQMALILLSICFVLVSQRLLANRINFVFILFSLYFIAAIGAANILLGGKAGNVQVTNQSAEYERFYYSSPEKALTTWLDQNTPATSVINSDESMYRKLTSEMPERRLRQRLVTLAEKDSYIIMGNTNTKGYGYLWLSGESVRYNIPQQDIAENTNKIYSAGSNEHTSSVWRR